MFLKENVSAKKKVAKKTQPAAARMTLNEAAEDVLVTAYNSMSSLMDLQVESAQFFERAMLQEHRMVIRNEAEKVNDPSRVRQVVNKLKAMWQKFVTVVQNFIKRIVDFFKRVFSPTSQQAHKALVAKYKEASGLRATIKNAEGNDEAVTLADLNTAWDRLAKARKEADSLASYLKRNTSAVMGTLKQAERDGGRIAEARAEISKNRAERGEQMKQVTEAVRRYNAIRKGLAAAYTAQQKAAKK